MWLTSKERSYLNQIYANAYKKYFTLATDYALEMDGSRLEPAPPLAIEDTRQIASQQLEASVAYINAVINGKIAAAEANYAKKAALINTEAQKRGFINSTIAVQSLQSALGEKNARIETLENERAGRLAKYEDAALERTAQKIYSDSVKNAVSVHRLNLSVANAKSQRQARSLSDRMDSVISDTEALQLVDKEVYAAYLNFLFGYAVSDALSLVENEPAFALNLTTVSYNKLVQEITRRGY